MRSTRPLGLTQHEAFDWFMPGPPPPAPSLTEGCWDWSGGTYPSGYGCLSVGGRRMIASRASYERYVGSIPVGMSVLHSCDRPICVQPAHLRAGTGNDNVRDRQERGRGSAAGVTGTANRLAKLDDQSVREIRRLHAEGRSMYGLARERGIAPETVRDVVRRVTWKHVE